MSGNLLALVLSAFQIAQLPQFARITFNVPVDAEHGGGTALGAAGRVEFVREDYVVASGGVSLRHGAMEVQADRVEVDLKTDQVVATGDVILDEGPRRMAGNRLEYDLETKTGTIYEAKGYADPDLYFYGDEIRKTGEDTYEVIDGVLTSCDDPVPDWSFRVSRATVRLEGFARIYNTRMRMLKMPFLYMPFLMVPAKSERTSGFLLPNLGYSERQGYTIGGAYFQTLGERADATFYADYYEGGTFRLDPFQGYGLELRYAPTEITHGVLEGYLVDDPGLVDPLTGEVQVEEGGRWKLDWQHQSDEAIGKMRLVVNHTDFSDFDFFRDFSRNFDDITVRQVASSGYLSGGWGSNLLSILLDRREQFIGAGRIRELRQLPEVQYRLNNRQLGRAPLYLSLLTSANYFHILPEARLLNLDGDPDTPPELVESEDYTYGRADLLPQLTVPVPSPPWFSLQVALAGRGTYWTDSQRELCIEDPATEEQECPPPPLPTEAPLSGETLTRLFGSATAGVVGPSISKVFHKGMGSFGKFKHIVEPRFNYRYASEFDEQDRVLRFDEVDTTAPVETAQVSLVNRLLAKPADEESLYGAREIMSFELSQQYALREDEFLQTAVEPETGDLLQTQEGPISGRFRFVPSLYTSVDASASLNTIFNELNSVNLSARTRAGEAATLALSWSLSFDPATGETRGSQIRFGDSLDLFRGRVLFSSQVNYDIEAQLLQQHSHVFEYVAQCWTLRLEGREFRRLEGTEELKDYDLRLALSLKNVGTFLDLNSSTRTTGQTGFFY